MASGLPSRLPEGLASAMDVVLEALGERYELAELLGEGRFSQVFAATRTDADTDQVVALKMMELDMVTEDEEALEMLEAECTALRLASEHEKLRTRVVRLHEVFCTPHRVYLALDRVNGFELFNIIEEHGALPPPFVRAVMVQLLEALDALHAVGIVHRDIKPENLIVSHFCKDGDMVAASPPKLTLIDFGYACTLGPDELCEGLAGSPEYAAPEVLSWIDNGDDKEAEPYGGSADIWSAGVTAHVMICGELPFELPDGEDVTESDLVEAARNIRLHFEQPQWREEGMETASDFVRNCMIPDVRQRPTAAETLKLAWLREKPVRKTKPPALNLNVLKSKGSVKAVSSAALQAESAKDQVDVSVADGVCAAETKPKSIIPGLPSLPFSMPPLKLKDLHSKKEANLPVRDTGFSPRGVFSPRRTPSDRSNPLSPLGSAA